MDFELSWLKARLFVEEEGEPPVYRNTETGQTSTEAYVTANMLDVAMKTLFGVCPWDEWNYKSKFIWITVQSARNGKRGKSPRRIRALGTFEGNCVERSLKLRRRRAYLRAFKP
jgi:hypothetical protein